MGFSYKLCLYDDIIYNTNILIYQFIATNLKILNSIGMNQRYHKFALTLYVRKNIPIYKNEITTKYENINNV